MADVSGDEAMTKAVVEGADLHCMMARVLYSDLKELSDEEIVENHSDKRQFSKAPRFAMQYGGNDYTLHVNENIPKMEAKIIFDKFIELHQGLFDWGKNTLEIALKKGYIESVDGWRLALPYFDEYKHYEKIINDMTKENWKFYREGKEESNREKMIKERNESLKEGEEKLKFTCLNVPAYEYYKKKVVNVSRYFSRRSNYQRLALNNPIQTRGAHQMKLALCYIFEWIVEKNAMFEILMCNAVHDETVLDAPEELAEETKEAVGFLMRKAGDAYLNDLKIQADANVGQTWYDAK